MDKQERVFACDASWQRAQAYAIEHNLEVEAFDRLSPEERRRLGLDSWGNGGGLPDGVRCEWVAIARGDGQ